MRERASPRLECFGSRAKVSDFDLNSTDWFPLTEGVDCVVSSLSLHHLVGDGKRNLFQALYNNIANECALLIADLIEPQRPEVRNIFADTYDRLAEAQSRFKGGSIDLYSRLVQEECNYYRFPNSEEQPSPLFDQLMWLKNAGFPIVDCFWLQAGHAICGGYKSVETTITQRVSFSTALHVVATELD